MSNAFILAIDIGSGCGFVVGNNGAMLSGAGKSTEIRTLLDNARRLPISRIVYRAPAARARNGRKRKVEHAAETELRNWAAMRGVPCAAVPGGVVKRAFGVKGNAQAHDLLAEAERRGFNPATVAEARAIAVFHHALSGVAA